jgi:DNA-binding MarR family transcriptional regulator
MAGRPAIRRPETRPTAGRVDLSFGPLEDIVGLHVGLANAAIQQDFKQKFDELRLTPKQTSLLWLVGDNPGVSQVDFARLFRIDRATLMGITNALTRRGLIERRTMQSNGRRIGLHLTPAGGQMLEEAKRRVAIHEAWVKRRFTRRELDQIVSLMARLYADD